MTIKKVVLVLMAALFLLISANAVRTLVLYHTFGYEISTSNIENTISDRTVIRPGLQNIQGAIRKAMDKRRIDNIYKLENGHLTNVIGRAQTKDCADAVIALDTFCREENVPLLYINLPSKYSYSERLLKQYGLNSYSKENADSFLKAIENEGVDVLDLSSTLFSGKDDPMDIFFKTDHHWKPSAALDAVRSLTDYANGRYRLGLETSRIAEGRFNVQHHPSSWTGEYGQKVSTIYAGKDDLDIITPKDPGKFRLRIPSLDLDEKGDFSVMLDEKCLNSENFYYVSAYYTYLYGNYPILTIDDLDVKNGRILLIKDSFGNAAAPYLAMTCSRLVLRDERYSDDDIKKLISSGDFDAVFIMYSDSAIRSVEGDPNSPFTFAGIDL